MRSNTAAPGAYLAILCSSVLLSAANCHTPARRARAVSSEGLIGWVNRTVEGSAPARMAARTSAQDAASNRHPAACRAASIQGSGLALTA
jgi:hypothetical protein